MSEFVFNAEAATISAPDASVVSLESADFQNIKSTARLSVFYRREDIMELLSQPGCRGIRFYPALNGNNEFSTLAVGTNGQKRDIVSGDTSKCFVSEGTLPATRVTQSRGLALIGQVNQHIAQAVREGRANTTPLAASSTFSTAKSYSKVLFTSAALESMLADGASGIRFFSSRVAFDNDGNSFSTLAAVAVNASGTESSDGVMSLLPCPPDCGGGGYTDDNFSVL